MFWEQCALALIQSYWIIWLVGSFVVSIILGGVIFRNYEIIKGSR